MEFSHRRRVETSGELAARAQRGQRLSAPGSRHGYVRDLRKPRHAGIFQAIHRLDAALDQAARAELGRWAREQYEAEFGDVPVGFVAECHLGPPYADHRLDLFQSIVDHYAPADVMPEPFARARMLVRTGAYEFIEIYASGELRPVLADGSVVI
jgi:hypothetical protein